MGLSSNQARFLSITARKCDLEYRMQQICNRRLRLSNELQGAARTYDDQTSDRKLFLKNLNTDSIQTTGEYNPISEANLENNGYYIMDTGSDGKGSEILGSFGSGSVFEVKTAADLTTALKNSNKDSKIILENDLNLTGANFATGSNFAGTFYANGKTVTTDKALFNNINAGASIFDMNLQAAAGTTLASGSGLLATSNQGTIDNVVVSGNISATGNSNVGGIVANNYGTISGSSSTATISGTSNIGGIAASNFGTLDTVYGAGSITGSNSGGIVGTNSGTITTANSKSSVTGNYSGGIVGSNSGTITTANSSSAVSGNYSGGIAGTNTATGDLIKVTTTQTSTVNGAYSGGIVGTNYGDVDHSTSIGTVSGSTTDGAIAGQNSGTISTALAGGSVTSTNAGGIAGTNNSGGTIKDTYVISTVSGTTSGSVAGTNNGSIDGTNIFVSGETTNTNAVGTGTSTAQSIAILSSDTIAAPLDSSLTSDWTKPSLPGLPTISDVPVTIATTTNPNGGTATKALASAGTGDVTVLSSSTGLVGNNLTMYNQLATAYGGAIDGTNLQIVKYQAAIPNAAGGYTQQEIVSLAIKTAAGLKTVDTQATSGANKAEALQSNYLLMNDVTLTGTNNWTAIGDGSTAFTGMFDGNLKKITGINIVTSAQNYQGMFGSVGDANGIGSVVRTNLDSTSITNNAGTWQYVGSVAGQCNGTIENCTSTNINITSNAAAAECSGFVGGIAGYVGNTSGEKASVSKSSVDGTMNMGVASCFQVGGFAGWLTGGQIELSSAAVNINNTNSNSNYMSVFVSDLNSLVQNPIKYCYATGDLNVTSTYVSGHAPTDYKYVMTGDTNQHNSTFGTGDDVNQSDVGTLSYVKNTATAGQYAVYEGTQHPTLMSSLPAAFASATTKVNGVDVPIWDTTTGKLNIAATNTVTYNYSTYDVTGQTAPTQTAAVNAAPTTTTAPHALPTYTPAEVYTAKTKGLDPNVSLEEGLRSGRYQLVVNSDMQTQNPVKGSNSGDTTYEKVDWRTQPIISDELDTSNDAAAQTTYDRVVRDVDEQDKLLQMEQEKISTEYQAITSEKDAVKKILDTNAQGSFKYFS